VAQRGADIAASPLGPVSGPRYSVTPDQARHLAGAYGDKAFDVLELVKWSNGALAAPLAPGLPVIEAEVVHAARQEYAASVEDFLMRRTRLAFLDAAAAEAAAPRVAELMAGELGWGTRRRRAEAAAAVRALRREFAIPAPAEKGDEAAGESKGTAAAA
jgi:glycerol-3-phosphate dehydrogenase